MQKLTNKQKSIIFIAVCVSFYVICEIIMRMISGCYYPMKVEFRDTHLCSKKADGYETVDFFHSTEKMFICTFVDMSHANQTIQVFLILFQDEIKNPKDRIWDETLDVDEGSMMIPVDLELSPGHYCLQVKEVRSTLYETCFDVK